MSIAAVFLNQNFSTSCNLNVIISHLGVQWVYNSLSYLATMFDFLKRKKTTKASLEKTKAATEPMTPPGPGALAHTPTPENNEKRGLFSRLKQGLGKTRRQLTAGIVSLVRGKKQIDPELLQALEEQLIMADIGVTTSQVIIKTLTQQLSRQQLKDSAALLPALQATMVDLLKAYEAPFIIPEETKPFLILMVGVNGAGKTTTIGKLAKRLQGQGKKVMLAAGDTFRAAAVEQLQIWGERNQIPVIAQQSGADSASVIYDAFQAAKARDFDVLIADTAGRLHTQTNLMEELKKIKRVIAKIDATAPHETMLVVDAVTGQNALSQARLFNAAVKLTGISLTKLDGTAKGGIIFAIANELRLPLRFIGIGESIEDLRPFQAEEFVSALFEFEDEAIRRQGIPNDSF
jgi:fused signal recognition particle receptor